MSLLSANLKAFLAVANLGTVHGAARELHLTQTGVTQRLRSLEAELGTTLFLRSRRGMKLTPEGEALLRYCKGAEDLEGQVLSQIIKGGKDKSIDVTLIGPTSVVSARVVDQCADLYREWPLLRLHFVVGDEVDRISYVKSGRATMAIVPREQVPNEMESKVLKPDRYLLVATSKWKGRRLTDILENERVIDFDENDSTTSNYLRKFNLNSQRDRLFVNNNEALVKLFAKGVGFGTLTQEVAKSHLESGRLIALNGGAFTEDPLALTWYPRPEMPPYLKAVIDSIR